MSKLFLNNNVTGDLWVEKPGGEKVHLGTIHLDVNEFHEADEDGVQGRIFGLDNLIGKTIVVKGWSLFHDDFERFRRWWLSRKFPYLFWN